MNAPAPKPCPFCRSNAVLFKELIPDCPAGYFMCVDCGAHTGSCIHEAEALIQWNRRPNPETQAVAGKHEDAVKAAICRAAEYGWEHASWEWKAVSGGLDRFLEQALRRVEDYPASPRSPVEAVPVSALRELEAEWRAEAELHPLKTLAPGGVCPALALEKCADRLSAVIRGTKT